ncbi:unnamed protein product, partial [Allacma fusca]|jgi:hypothetical protein
MCE